MHTPQTIVIIGAAETGKTIARGLSNGNDRVLLCDHDFHAAHSFTRDLQQAFPSYDIEAVDCSYEATWEGDIIVLALPSCPDRQEVAKNVKAVANQKVVIITDGDVTELQSLLPHTKIVRIDASAFGKNGAFPPSTDCLVQGEDAEAVQTAASLVRTVGWNPVVVQKAIA